MKLAITGSEGFVGRKISQKLVEAGHALYLYDVCQPSVRCGGHVYPIIGNLATGEGLEKVPWGELDVVVHLAAAGVKASRRTWMECLQVNAVGTQRLLECLRMVENPPRLVYARTFYENHMEVRALAENPYMATKKIASDLIKIYQQQTGAAATSVTIYQAYGPGDDGGNVISYIINQLRQNQPALLGSGAGLRDWIYIDDLVDSLVAAVTAPAGDYDLGTGMLYSLRDVAEQIADIMEAPKSLLVFDPARDRGDLGIKDCATRLLPELRLENTLNDGLQKIVRLGA
jgi:UDP-glucose 4-epimerase